MYGKNFFFFVWMSLVKWNSQGIDILSGNCATEHVFTMYQSKNRCKQTKKVNSWLFSHNKLHVWQLLLKARLQDGKLTFDSAIKMQKFHFYKSQPVTDWWLLCCHDVMSPLYHQAKCLTWYIQVAVFVTALAALINEPPCLAMQQFKNDVKGVWHNKHGWHVWYCV